MPLSKVPLLLLHSIRLLVPAVVGPTTRLDDVDVLAGLTGSRTTPIHEVILFIINKKEMKGKETDLRKRIPEENGGCRIGDEMLPALGLHCRPADVTGESIEAKRRSDGLGNGS